MDGREISASASSHSEAKPQEVDIAGAGVEADLHGV
jgi:hypothetical protein